MRRRFPPRPSAGLAVALVALFVALGGSAAAKLIINGSNVRDGSLTGADIKDRSIGGVKIKNNSLTGTQINESSLATVPSAKHAETTGRWALIAGTPTDAHILAQSGSMTVDRVAAGLYLVDAGTSVTGKPLSATLNFPPAALISVAPCGGTANNPGGINCPVLNDTNHVQVRTLNAAPTTPVDATFYLSIGG